MIGEEGEESSANGKSHGPLTQLQKSGGDTKMWTKREQRINTKETLQTESEKIYIIDRRCRPPLITAVIPMISLCKTARQRQGQSLRQTKDVHSEKRKVSERQTDLKRYNRLTKNIKE